jgi:hypothetical protein
VGKIGEQMDARTPGKQRPDESCGRFFVLRGPTMDAGSVPSTAACMIAEVRSNVGSILGSGLDLYIAGALRDYASPRCEDIKVQESDSKLEATK